MVPFSIGSTSKKIIGLISYAEHTKTAAKQAEVETGISRPLEETDNRSDSSVFGVPLESCLTKHSSATCILGDQSIYYRHQIYIWEDG